MTGHTCVVGPERAERFKLKTPDVEYYVLRTEYHYSVCMSLVCSTMYIQALASCAVGRQYAVESGVNTRLI